jgi:uncharacterized protein (DUF433 family)
LSAYNKLVFLSLTVGYNFHSVQKAEISLNLPRGVFRPRIQLEKQAMDEQKLLERITVDPRIFAGKPIIRGRRLAVEHVLGMLAAGDTIETIMEGYPWLEVEDVRACLVYAARTIKS